MASRNKPSPFSHSSYLSNTKKVTKRPSSQLSLSPPSLLSKKQKITHNNSNVIDLTTPQTLSLSPSISSLSPFLIKSESSESSSSNNTTVETTTQSLLETTESSNSSYSHENKTFSPSITIDERSILDLDTLKQTTPTKGTRKLVFVPRRSIKSATKSPLISIPHDVLLLIFSYFENFRDVVSCMLVCKYWNACAIQGEAILFRSIVHSEVSKNWNFILETKEMIDSLCFVSPEGSLSLTPTLNTSLDLKFIQTHFKADNWRDALIFLENKKKQWHPLSEGKPSFRHTFKNQVRQVLLTENNEILTLAPRLGVIVWHLNVLTENHMKKQKIGIDLIDRTSVNPEQQLLPHKDAYLMSLQKSDDLVISISASVIKIWRLSTLSLIHTMSTSPLIPESQFICQANWWNSKLLVITSNDEERTNLSYPLFLKRQSSVRPNVVTYSLESISTTSILNEEKSNNNDNNGNSTNGLSVWLWSPLFPEGKLLSEQLAIVLIYPEKDCYMYVTKKDRSQIFVRAELGTFIPSIRTTSFDPSFKIETVHFDKTSNTLGWISKSSDKVAVWVCDWNDFTKPHQLASTHVFSKSKSKKGSRFLFLWEGFCMFDLGNSNNTYPIYDSKTYKVVQSIKLSEEGTFLQAIIADRYLLCLHTVNEGGNFVLTFNKPQRGQLLLGAKKGTNAITTITNTLTTITNTITTITNETTNETNETTNTNGEIVKTEQSNAEFLEPLSKIQQIQLNVNCWAFKPYMFVAHMEKYLVLWL